MSWFWANRLGWTPVVLASLVAACEPEEEEKVVEPRPVRAVEVTQSDGGTYVTIAGTIEAVEQVNLGFLHGGRMIERLVRVGDSVEPGQVVARLDSSNEENALRAAEANLAAVSGQLSEARINFDRQQTLYQRQIAARVAFERAEQVYSTASAAADAAEAQVAVARRRLDETVLYADAPGVVIGVGAEPGEVVSAGRAIVQVARDNGRDAVLSVPANILETSPPDPEVTVALSLNPSVSTKGRVREIAPQADPVTGTFQVRIGLIEAPAELRLGSAVTARAFFGSEGGIVLPATALTRSEGSPAVWVVDPDSGTVTLRPIEVGTFAPSAVQVASGLEVGEIVVTAGVQALRPGQEVRLLGADS
ncbi:efflux RND transporter periplasmic adaptor subunit [Sedimentitalea sp. JM2-8]|uniref:Efflux RND transporter periplasmic adaptor subunit n=1 Tax=Sedimentitalea xiamensis TaxID=3050037 RepID=A0ABT7FCW5_9RHOB|nr:efflux RND transporter periplasmic adaptor subunit [Sedimentitalea xiamensis]MDK3072900.1 efflux RND transporter periplasmic adaptor subunit [Sedimentitalea xiamensis]